VKGARRTYCGFRGRYEGADGEEQPLDPRRAALSRPPLTRSAHRDCRALGIASRGVDGSHETAAITDESDLVFSGFAVFLDPPKASAGATIQAMAAAGVSVKVLTRRQ